MIIGIQVDKDKRIVMGQCAEVDVVLSGNPSHTIQCTTTSGEIYDARAADVILCSCDRCNLEFSRTRFYFFGSRKRHGRDLCKSCSCKKTSLVKYGVESPNQLSRRKLDSALSHGVPSAEYTSGPRAPNKTSSAKELSELRAANARKLWQDPLYRAEHESYLEASNKNPQNIEKRRLATVASWQTPDRRNKHTLHMKKMWTNPLYRETMAKTKTRISKPQRDLYEKLKTESDAWLLEYPIPETYYTADLYNPTTKEIVEFYGDYWHCNPSKFEESFYHKHIHMTAKEIWEKDRVRTEALQKLGYSVRVVWES